MKAVIQRVTRASVAVDGIEHNSIGHGFLVLLGVHRDDSQDDIDWIVRKIAGLRVLEDSNGRMNESLKSKGGEILLISQFTLIASNRKGNRPSFNEAANPEKGDEYYSKVAVALSEALNNSVKIGVFGANMQVSLVNDGPVTILFDTRNKE